MEIEDSASTDTDSMTEVSISYRRKSNQGSHWILHQNVKDDDPGTDRSEIDDFIDDEDSRIHPVPVALLRASGTKTFYQTSFDNDQFSSKSSKKRPIIDTPLKKDDLTDGEDLEISPDDFFKIVQEELNTRGKSKLKLKGHATTVSLKKTNLSKPLPTKCQIGEDEDTDCSDVDVSMIDYYAIRHQNQSTIHSKRRVKPNKLVLETDSEEENDVKQPTKPAKADGESDVSDLEVNMKDYYVIRHETSPKCVSGPFEIDFGQTTFECSSLKKTKGSQLVPVNPIENGRDTDDEDISCANNETTFKEFLEAQSKNQRKDFDLRKFQTASTECHLDGKKADCFSGSLSESSEEESYDSEPSNSASFPTEYDAEELSQDVSALLKKQQPIIRLVEIDGCQGAVGVVCEPTSPTRDNVHGIKFLESLSLNEKTEEFSNISEVEEDAELMEKGDFAPATDDEEISELEMDSKGAPFIFVLPECKKKICHTKTSLDGKTVTSEKMVKLDQSVSLNQFVKETEKLSESDVCDWSEEERDIARRLSGDFGKIKRIKDVTKPKELNVKGKTSGNKKSGRQRKRGRKKSDGKEIKSPA